LLSCRDGQAIPIHLTIEPETIKPMQITDQVATQADK
jgi:hypothetical protein